MRDLGRRRPARRSAERVGREAGDQGGVPLPEEGAARVRDKVGHQLALLKKSGSLIEVCQTIKTSLVIYHVHIFLASANMVVYTLR